MLKGCLIKSGSLGGVQVSMDVCLRWPDISIGAGGWSGGCKWHLISLDLPPQLLRNTAFPSNSSVRHRILWLFSQKQLAHKYIILLFVAYHKNRNGYYSKSSFSVGLFVFMCVWFTLLFCKSWWNVYLCLSAVCDSKTGVAREVDP